MENPKKISNDCLASILQLVFGEDVARIGMCSYKMMIRLSLTRPKEFVSNLTLLHAKMIHEGTTSVQLLAKPKRLPYRDILRKTKSSCCTEVFLESQICNLPQSLTRLSIPKDIHLTKKVFSKLPPGLTFLDLTSNMNFGMHRIWHKIPVGLEHLSLGSICSQNFAHLPHSLTHLNLPNSDNLFDKHIPHLPPNLTFLALGRNTKITDAGIRLLPPLLTHLDLQNNQKISDDAIQNLPKHLTHLDLRNSLKISGDAIQNLPKHLTFLALGYLCRPNTREDILLPSKLKTFRIASFKWNAELSPEFMPKDLTRLRLRSSVCCRALLNNLPHRLVHLTLGLSTDSFLDEHVAMLPRCLEHLKLSFSISIRSESLAHLPNSLKSIHLVGETFSDEFVRHLPSGLSILSLAQNNLLTDAAMAQLPKKLTQLELPHNELITDIGISHLPRELTYLDLLWNKMITDIGISHLPRGLTYLDLSWNMFVTDAGIPHLPRGLTHLDLSRTLLVTDAGIPHLPQGLLHLYLVENCNITNKSVVSLPRSLKSLDLLNTNVTDESIDQAPPFLKWVRWKNTDDE